jgi:hypothetical protein
VRIRFRICRLFPAKVPVSGDEHGVLNIGNKLGLDEELQGVLSRKTEVPPDLHAHASTFVPQIDDRHAPSP